jgi:hypothetical protein
MENKKFVEEINDASNRVFPLGYKYVNTVKLTQPDEIYDKSIYVDLYQTKDNHSFVFNKPISKYL